jgi:hypothetical protein
MICAPAAGRPAFRKWEYGIGTAESTARTAQMITFRKTNSESVRETGAGTVSEGGAVGRICDGDDALRDVEIFAKTP